MVGALIKSIIVSNKHQVSFFWRHFSSRFSPTVMAAASAGSNILSPPSSVRGMKKLNRDLFKKFIDVPCVIIPISKITKAKTVLNYYLLKLLHFRPIRSIEYDDILKLPCDVNNSESSKVAIMNPLEISCFDNLKREHKESLLSLGIDSIHIGRLLLVYDNWKADEILRSIIPEEYDNVSGYSLCGHIVHVNLREQLIEYKSIIGEVLLDKVAAARCVVNKVDTIDSTFRTFNMELLSGDQDYITSVKENKASFIFDFSKVYWNPRLSTEHERLVSKFKKGDVVYDIFCGVGPFSIPARKIGCRVLANDLNPESIKWLKESMKMNKVELEVYNLDGGEFIKKILKEDVLNLPKDFNGSIHIPMNLPALAVSFLPSFVGLFSKDEMEIVSSFSEPIAYVYCFIKGEENVEEAARSLVEESFGFSLDNAIEEISFVRNVAPMKEMMRVTVRLTSKILFRCKRVISNDETKCKKFCAE